MNSLSRPGELAVNSSNLFWLRLFGSPSIAGPDGAIVTGRAVQRHRLALLALLALAPGRCSTRDRLLGYLWPESDSERARQLLNQSVYHLRKALGEDAILSAGDELRLNSAVVDADVASFESALAQGDAAIAVALYQGPLLDGFFLSDAPEFERWIDRERERLAGAYARALESLAVVAEAQPDFTGAAEWWKVRAAHDPYDSRVALRLMQALQASGNRAGALQHATSHARLLQVEFGITPGAEVQALAERLRRESATNVAAVRGGPEEAIDSQSSALRSDPEASRAGPGSAGAETDGGELPSAAAAGTVEVGSTARGLSTA